MPYKRDFEFPEESESVVNSRNDSNVSNCLQILISTMRDSQGASDMKLAQMMMLARILGKRKYRKAFSSVHLLSERRMGATVLCSCPQVQTPRKLLWKLFTIGTVYHGRREKEWRKYSSVTYFRYRLSWRRIERAVGIFFGLDLKGRNPYGIFEEVKFSLARNLSGGRQLTFISTMFTKSFVP